MARYCDSVCKLCRNEGTKLFLKGSRCYTSKCAIERRRYPSGQHGQDRKKQSEFAVQLREKQKVRRGFGVLERQFARYFDVAAKQKAVPTGLRLLQLLETRLDNIVHRSGLVPSRAQARQLIRHGHITVDGKKVSSPSFQLKTGQVVSVAENSKALVKKLISENASTGAPHWVAADLENLKVSVQQLPVREDLDQTIKEALIVEFYSR
ncbi:MAG: 30S ribosomal protein S4 [Candidatus Obscuribacterales bacterium]|nr:30S ribosomal protein S4 [Candidatus Obscuribacterales bacterium]